MEILITLISVFSFFHLVLNKLPICPQTGMEISHIWEACECLDGGGETSNVWGTDGVFTSDSNVCRAARHDGNIGVDGGCLHMRHEGGRSSYASADKNGVQTLSFGSFHKTLRISNANCPNPTNPPSCPLTGEGIPEWDWYTCSCSTICPCATTGEGSVWGTSGRFTLNSNICRAALFEGLVSQNGGCLQVLHNDGYESYSSGYKNGVFTLDYGRTDSSFLLQNAHCNTIVSNSPKCPNTAEMYRGKDGNSYSCYCDPESGTTGNIKGRGDIFYYTDDSPICRAASHKGIIDPNVGGCVYFTIYPGEESYDNSYGSYGIISDTSASHPGSYNVYPSDSCNLCSINDATGDNGIVIDVHCNQCDYMRGFVPNDDNSKCVMCENGIAQANGECKIFEGVSVYDSGKFGVMEIMGIPTKVRWNPMCYISQNHNVEMEIYSSLISDQSTASNEELEQAAIDHFIHDNGWSHGYDIDVLQNCKFPSITSSRIMTMNFAHSVCFHYTPVEIAEYATLVNEIFNVHHFSHLTVDASGVITIGCTVGVGIYGPFGCDTYGFECETNSETWNLVLDEIKGRIYNKNFPIDFSLSDMKDIFDSIITDGECGFKDSLSCGISHTLSEFSYLGIGCSASIGFFGFELDIPSIQCATGVGFANPDMNCDEEWEDFFISIKDMSDDIAGLQDAAAAAAIDGTGECWELVKAQAWKGVEFLLGDGSVVLGRDFIFPQLSEWYHNADHFFQDAASDIAEYFHDIGTSCSDVADLVSRVVIDENGYVADEIVDFSGDLVGEAEELGLSAIDIVWDLGSDVCDEIDGTATDVVDETGDVFEDIEDIIEQIFDWPW